MDEAPPSEIESHLRGYAADRLQAVGEPLEMHPATREMLHGEVRRIHADRSSAESDEATSVRGWGALGMRLLLGGGVLAALALILYGFNQGGKSKPAFELAQNSLPEPEGAVGSPPAAGLEPRAQAQTVTPPEAGAMLREVESQVAPPTPLRLPGNPVAVVPSPEPAPTSAPAMMGGELPMKKAAGKTAKSLGPSLSALPAPTADVVAPSATPAPSALEEVDQSGMARVAEPLAPGPLPMPQEKARMRTMPMSDASGTAQVEGAGTLAGEAMGLAGAASGPERKLTFVSESQPERLRRNFNSPERQPVLNRFVVTQQGPSIQVQDGDGSVYEGQVLSPESAVLGRPLMIHPGPSGGVGGGRQKAVPPVRFRVSGMNRTLNQNLVFEGQIQPTQRTAPSPSPTAAGEAPTSFQLQGRVTVNQRIQQPVQAVSRPANP